MATFLSQHYTRSSRLKIRRACVRGIRCRLWPDPLIPRFIGGESSSRLKHLVSLMYFSQLHDWQAVLSFHGAVLLEIERGLLKWEDLFLHLESCTLYGHLKATKPSASASSSDTVQVLFCRDYQRGTCSFQQDHYGFLRGERKWLRHICADCWVKGRTQALHPEGSKECPSFANSAAIRKLRADTNYPAGKHGRTMLKMSSISVTKYYCVTWNIRVYMLICSRSFVHI